MLGELSFASRVRVESPFCCDVIAWGRLLTVNWLRKGGGGLQSSQSRPEGCEAFGNGGSTIVGTDLQLLLRLARSAGGEVAERRGLAISVMVIAACVFSTSPVLVRWAAPLSPALITSGRLLVAGLAVAILAWMIRSPGLDVGQLRRLALYGLIAALHFQLYVASLSYTTVAHSLTLVYTAPVFVALFTWIVLGERIPAGKLLGLPVVVIGVGLIAGFESRLDPTMALGDLMAVGSAICYGLYSVAGRRERRAVPVATYAATVYATAGLWLLPFAILAPGEVASAGPNQWAAILALGIFPLAIGHTLYNTAVRLTNPIYVNLIATQEVIGGIALSAIFLGEQLTWPALAGAVVTLAGVTWVVAKR